MIDARANTLGLTLGPIRPGQSPSFAPPALALDYSTDTDWRPLERTLNLRTWSLPYAVAMIRGWLPESEQDAEVIGTILSREQMTLEGRALQDTLSYLRTAVQVGDLDSFDPGERSEWRRVKPEDVIAWASGPHKPAHPGYPPSALEHLLKNHHPSLELLMVENDGLKRQLAHLEKSISGFRAISANVALRQILAIAYTVLALKEDDDVTAAVQELKKLIAEARPEGLNEFQRTIIDNALREDFGRLQSMFLRAEDLFSDKAIKRPARGRAR